MVYNFTGNIKIKQACTLKQNCLIFAVSKDNTLMKRKDYFPVNFYER
ncbi:hypothetical protein BACEGG_01693 [Bacteroides eggerthii DSM 20697]|jgi:hypothetical protein|nr:hypothetical protein BACEGG_01693 [Bacteroides eggerthii DSM 20697]